jgi:hypothetical protein
MNRGYRDRSRSRGDSEPLTPEEEAAARTLASLKNDLEVQAAFEDGESAAEGRSGGGKKKRRGGAKGGRAIAEAVAEGEGKPKSEKNKPEDEVKTELKAAAASGETPAVAKVVAANPGTIRRIVEAALRARAAVRPAMLVAGAATLANQPTLFGNIARVAAASVRTGLDTTITSTWAQWGQTGSDILGAVKDVGVAIFDQSVQGPVVPFTIAMMLQAYRASSRGMGILELTKSDAATAAEIVRKGIAGQKAAFDLAYAEEAKKKPIADLREATNIMRGRPMTRGPGALDTSMAARSSAAPAVGSTGVVPGFLPPGPPGAPIMGLAAVPPSAIEAAAAERQDRRERVEGAEALMGLRASSAAPAPMEDEVPTGARRRRRTKRRAPKRKRVTRKMPIFVY